MKYKDYKGLVFGGKNISNGVGYGSIKDFVSKKLKDEDYKEMVCVKIYWSRLEKTFKLSILYLDNSDNKQESVVEFNEDVDVLRQLFENMTILITDNDPISLSKIENLDF